MNGVERCGAVTYKVEVIGTTQDSTVMVRDTLGDTHEVHDVRPKGVPPPQAGEAWLMERVGGKWRLTVMLNPLTTVPVITGSRSDAGLAEQLLDALAAWGLVVDQTTPDLPNVLP